MAQQQFAYRLKRAALIASVIAVALLTAAALFYGYAARKDFYFNEINKLVREHAGYILEKSGPLEFSLLPRPSLSANRLKISNPALSENAELAVIGHISMVIDWLPLLRLQLQADVEMDSPDINLVIDDNGRESWMTEELLTVSGGLPFDVGRIDTRGLKLLFKNHQKNEILGFELEQFDLDFVAGKGSARIESAGRMGPSRFFAIGDAVYELDTKRLNLDLDIGAGRAGTIKVSAINAPSVARWIKQNAPFFPLRGRVKGAVSFENRTPTGRLEIDATLATLGDLDYLTDALAPARRDLGPVKANGRLLLTGGDLDIEGLNARLEHEHMRFSVSGGVSNLLSAVEAALQIKGEADGLSVLARPGLAATGPAADIIKRLGPLDVSASVRAGDGDFIISDLDLGLAHNSFSARVSGDIRLLREGIHVDIEHRSEAADSADLFKLFGIDQPKLADSGALQITASVSGKNGKYSLKDAAGALQGGNIRTRLDGEISLVDDALQFDLYSALDINDVSRVVALLPKDLGPYLEGLTGTATSRIHGALGDFSVSDMEVELAREGRRLVIQGDVSQLPGNPAPQIKFHFTTKNPVELEQYSPRLKSQQLTGPLDLIGEVSAAGNKIQIHNLVLQAEQTDVEGGIVINLDTDPPRIYAVFDSRQFLTQLVAVEVENEEGEPSDRADTSVQSQAETAADADIQKQSPSEAFRAYTAGVDIATDWIKDLDLYATFSAGQAKIGEYNISDLLLTVDARDGVLTLAEYQIKIDGRPTTFRGFIDTNAKPPVYVFSGEVQGDTLEALLALEDGIFVGGKLSGNFTLRSQGNTLGQAIENLDGKALITMGPLNIRSNALTVFSSDIVTGMLRGIVSTGQDQRASSYDCVVLGIDVNKGMARASKSFAMQSKDYNLAGKGKVDLNTGYVDLAVYPKARRGLGFSISTLVGGFKIKGHMATPDFGVTGGGLLTAMITGYALTPTVAVAANPATATVLVTGFFAKGIFDRLTANNYSCKNTLKRIERNRTRAGGTKSRNPHVPKWH